MNVEVKGVDFSNKGAELMLYSIISALDKHRPNHQLVLYPGHLLPYENRSRLGAWQKFSFSLLGVDWTWISRFFPRAAINKLRHFGIVVEQDIDLVLDASGFAYGDQWAVDRLEHTLNQLKRIKKRAARYIFLPQTFGPFADPKHAELIRKIVELADLVIPRDSRSAQYLEDSCDPSHHNKICQYPDITHGLQPNRPNRTVPLPDKFACVVPNTKVFSGDRGYAKNTYLSMLVAVVRILESAGLATAILNHGGVEDREFCLELLSATGNNPIYLDGLHPLETKGVIAQSAVCFSSRFHACVSSLSQGVPALATSWNHKYQELFGDYQLPDLVLDLELTADLLEQKILDLLKNRDHISAHLNTIASGQSRLSEDMWDNIFPNDSPCE